MFQKQRQNLGQNPGQNLRQNLRQNLGQNPGQNLRRNPGHNLGTNPRKKRKYRHLQILAATVAEPENVMNVWETVTEAQVLLFPVQGVMAL